MKQGTHDSCVFVCSHTNLCCFRQYEKSEEVVLWMNTVGPYHNRQETYSYFSLPFCVGPEKEISHYHETLSEALQGVELVFSGLDIDYQGSFSLHITCIATFYSLYILDACL
jgi:hypothetical protein